MSESLSNQKNAEEITEIDKVRLQYAWNWFDFHAKQRMQLFNFFLLITGILVNAFVASYEKNMFSVSIAICLLGVLQSISFFIFDVRSREMTSFSEDVLEKLERDTMFPDGFSHPMVRGGGTLGLLRKEGDDRMREGANNNISLKILFKMKWWIRAIELIVTLIFIAGLVLAGFRVSRTHNYQEKTETIPSQPPATKPVNAQTVGAKEAAPSEKVSTPTPKAKQEEKKK